MRYFGPTEIKTVVIAMFLCENKTLRERTYYAEGKASL